MKRTNTFALAPTGQQHTQLLEIADACARLWNELNYRRRQSFFKREIDWESKNLYDKYKVVVSATTAQQVQRKNSEAWKSYLALLKLRARSKLSPRVQKIKPPGYWKNRSTGQRKLLIPIRCDSYGLGAGTLKLPKKLEVRWKGQLEQLD